METPNNSSCINNNMDITMQSENCIILPKSKEYNKVIILLIGFGDTINSFSDIFIKLLDESGYNSNDDKGILKETKFIILSPKQIPVKAFDNNLLNSWYDFKYSIFNTKEDNINENDLNKHTLLLKKIINYEVKINKKVYLCGFSQGGSVALHAACVLNIPIEGVILFSSFMITTTKQIINEMIQSNSGVILSFKYIILLSGIHDEIIPSSAYDDIVNFFNDVKNSSILIISKSFKCEHSIISEQLTYIDSLIK